jgi:hypothetical protein
MPILAMVTPCQKVCGVLQPCELLAFLLS